MDYQVITLHNDTVVVSENIQQSVVTIESPFTVISTGGSQGLPGRDGVQSNLAPEFIAEQALGGFRVVKVTSSGKVDYASYTSVDDANKIVGITTGAAVANSPIGVQFCGRMTDSTWTFTPGPIYCGLNGVVTQTVPTTGFILTLGTALSSTEILINMKQPLFIN